MQLFLSQWTTCRKLSKSRDDLLISRGVGAFSNPTAQCSGPLSAYHGLRLPTLGLWKDTMSLKTFFRDKYFWIAAIVGVVLMLLTLHFNINPVEGSVVPQYIQGTGLDIFLFITCMPAWILGYIIGYLVSFFLPVSFPVMACITQFFFYGVLCKIIRRGINFLKHKRS